MKILKLILIILLFSFVDANADRCDSCKLKFDNLKTILEQKKIDQNDLEKAWQIASHLESVGYTDYVEYSEGKKYMTASLTKTFSDICIKVGGDIGVDYYLKYLSYTIGSAEEERSFALERLFVKNPEIILKRIRKYKEVPDKNLSHQELLGNLVWGFMNNRYYGAINPYENRDYTAMTVYDNHPEPVLNSKNCRKIFFETNPTLVEKYNEYKGEIDSIINLSIQSLQGTENESY